MSHTPNTKTTLKKLIKKISKEDIINETVPHNDIEEAQAASFKHQAARKSPKPQATSSKPQASSRKRQAP